MTGIRRPWGKLEGLLGVPFTLTRKQSFSKRSKRTMVRIRPRVSLLSFLERVLVHHHGSPGISESTVLATCETSVFFLRSPRRTILRSVQRISSFIRRRHPTVNHFGGTRFTVPIDSHGNPTCVTRRFAFRRAFHGKPAISYRGETMPTVTRVICNLDRRFFTHPKFTRRRGDQVHEPVSFH